MDTNLYRALPNSPRTSMRGAIEYAVGTREDNASCPSSLKRDASSCLANTCTKDKHVR